MDGTRDAAGVFPATILINLLLCSSHAHNEKSLRIFFLDLCSIGPAYNCISNHYFMKNRLYCDFKFYRVSKIKQFITIRDYKNEAKDSIEFKIYSDFILD